MNPRKHDGERDDAFESVLTTAYHNSQEVRRQSRFGPPPSPLAFWPEYHIPDEHYQRGDNDHPEAIDISLDVELRGRTRHRSRVSFELRFTLH